MKFENIRNIREDKDLLQKNIAKILFITSQQYQLYECGKRDFPVDLLIKLSEFYNVSVDYLLGLTDIMKPYPRKKYKN